MLSKANLCFLPFWGGSKETGCNLKKDISIAYSAGGFWRGEWIFPSDVQAVILNQKNSRELGRGKKFTKRGTFSHSRPNSPSLQRIQNGG